MTNKLIFRDKLGWPVERIKGRYILNFFRLLIHTSWRITWTRRHERMPKSPCSDNVNTCDGSLRYPRHEKEVFNKTNILERECDNG